MLGEGSHQDAFLIVSSTAVAFASRSRCAEAAGGADGKRTLFEVRATRVMFEDKQLVAEFVVESREHLADIETQLLAIEAAGNDVDAALVNDVFRAVHSIKGAAGFMGFVTLGKLAHELENVLNLVRTRQVAPRASDTDALLKAADALRRMVEDIEHSNEVDISAHLAALEEVVGQLIQAESSDAAEEPACIAVQENVAAEPAVADLPHESPPDESASKPLPEELPAREPQCPAAGPTSDSVDRRSSSQQDASASAAGSPSAEGNIRVPVSVLDRLMNLAGELVLSRNRLLQSVTAQDMHALTSVTSGLNQVTSDLQETVMRTRMQVVGTVFNRLPRVVRDLSNGLGKQCQLKVEGAEVELDKSIIEAIGDPLTHLIRNAVDHAVESPADRRAAGKPSKGTILLRAFHQSGKVHIAISDDGRGIDAAKLRQRAVAHGLVTADAARDMTDREALRLIFRPGFSTAERVTDVSGRGVGMDVVKTNIERIGGSVEIETQVGVGTTIHVKLPLTLAIIPSLIASCGNQRFAIPQSSISELVRLKAPDVKDRVQRLKNAEVLRLRDMLLPLVRLEHALGLEQPAAPDQTGTPTAAHNIIVVESGDLRYGLVVDRLHDSEEIVVKPLGKHMRGCRCLAGGTVLGDGTVALILDAAGIAAHCGLRTPEPDETRRGDEALGLLAAETPMVLLCRNDPAEQFAVAMQTVARLERIAAARIDTVGAQQVVQYRGGTLPLLSLEDHIAARPMPPAETLFVVVFTAARREMGLLIREVIDIHAVDAALDAHLFRQPGVIGSAIIGGKSTRLLDLYELARMAHPEWFAAEEALEQTDQSRGRILLAEDSDFFRTRLVEALQSAGYDVVACPDGAAAWESLQQPGQDFDLIVTDLEMPRLDGFELARKVRREATFRELPIFAVSSLAGDEDRQRAERAGINEYHIKLDRECLLDSIAQILQRSTTPTTN